ncbi:tectonic-2 isoform X2 [Pelobates fuscus]|uniref:tectonic-2 isoform X2 n=1 Tax=Pelobates fuscus TaxID=191477 RepID=UPI002FE4EB78
MDVTGSPLLLWAACALLVTAIGAQNMAGFFPSRILLSGPTATSYFVGNASVNLYLDVIGNTSIVPEPNCNGNSSTENWASFLESVTSTTNLYKVTVTLNTTLSCVLDKTPCFVEAIQVSACESNVPIASLLIQAEIYSNTTFTGNVSDNATVIPTQAYQPLGPCPCNLTAGACDIGCCCDQECTSSLRELFNGFCYTGVFGGNVTPPFDQLCSVEQIKRAPDWFPFLCVQSSIDNSPFLGYFFQGSTVSVTQPYTFSVSSQTIVQASVNPYKQGDPILVQQNGYYVYLTIPQQSTNGGCESNAPVAYLQNVVSTCVTYLKTCADVLTPNFNVTVQDGKGGSITPQIVIQNNTVDSGTVSGIQCLGIISSANYTFIWESNTLRGINITVLIENINLTLPAPLTQQFAVTFLTSDNINASDVLSGNPGYQVGKPVIAASGSLPLNKMTLNLWKPVGDSLCSSASPTPVLYGQNSYSGCILQVVNEDCNQIRENVTALLKSFVPVSYIAMSGNSKTTDLTEWVSIIYEESNSTCLGDCAAQNVMCLNVPVNMNIQILTAVTGAVEGIPQEEIIGVKISFSTVNVDCITSCTLSLPISSSVQFIKVPAQATPRVSSFQINYTEYDCEKNDVCWQQLAYPLTQYYTGEPHHLTLAKGMILVFFFIVASVLGGPWNRIRKAWTIKAF